jgi:hypothetical protein
VTSVGKHGANFRRSDLDVGAMTLDVGVMTLDVGSSNANPTHIPNAKESTHTHCSGANAMIWVSGLGGRVQG